MEVLTSFNFQTILSVLGPIPPTFVLGDFFAFILVFRETAIQTTSQIDGAINYEIRKERPFSKITICQEVQSCKRQKTGSVRGFMMASEALAPECARRNCFWSVVLWRSAYFSGQIPLWPLIAYEFYDGAEHATMR